MSKDGSLVTFVRTLLFALCSFPGDTTADESLLFEGFSTWLFWELASGLQLPQS